jgi:hypothetical protein
MQRVEFFFFFCGGGCYLVLVDTLLLDAVQVGFFFFFPLVRPKNFFVVVAFEGGRRDTRGTMKTFDFRDKHFGKFFSFFFLSPCQLQSRNGKRCSSSVRLSLLALVVVVVVVMAVVGACVVEQYRSHSTLFFLVAFSFPF